MKKVKVLQRTSAILKDIGILAVNEISVLDSKDKEVEPSTFRKGSSTLIKLVRTIVKVFPSKDVEVWIINENQLAPTRFYLVRLAAEERKDER